MCTHLRDHNHSLRDDEQAKLIVEKITAIKAEIEAIKAIEVWVLFFIQHFSKGYAMNRRAARWNWFSKLDPELTMFFIIMLFAGAWDLF